MTGVFKAASAMGVVPTVLGLLNFWSSDLVGTHLAKALLGLTGGPALVLGVYAISLRRRITALEARLGEAKPVGPQ